MDKSKFDLQRALDGVPVRCREQAFKPTIDRAADNNGSHALVGSVSDVSGMMKIFWNSDGRAVRAAFGIFTAYPDSDFDLLMAE